MATRARILADYVSGGATAAEFDYLDGVTSSIQTQLDAKSPTTGHANIATVGTVATGTWEATDVAVAHGGTGASTHTANNVLVGAGTSAITSVAPGADGQVLTSTGTVWNSEALPAASTSKLIIGNGGEDEVTLSGNTIAVTSSFHKMDTESDSANDQLDTISGGAHGQILILKISSSSRDTWSFDGTGNINMNVSANFQLNNNQDTLMLIYDATHSVWAEIARSDNASG